MSLCLAIFCLYALIPPVARVREATEQTIARNNLKQLLLAMHAYADVHDRELPPFAICNAEGRPLLSWRVLLLPYLDHEDLYRGFRVEESDTTIRRAIVRNDGG
jgi:hypothetical protein